MTDTVTDRAETLALVRQLFLDGLARSVQAAGIGVPRALAALASGAGQFYDDMASQGGRSGFEQAAGLTASKIRLVDDADLEFSIRLGDLARRLLDDCGVSLAKLHPRFAALLDRPDLEPTDNPIGPEAVRSGLTEMFGLMDWPGDQADKWLAEVGQRLVEDLPLLYAEISELLIRRQVPALRSSLHRAGEGVRGGAGGTRADPLMALQQAIGGAPAFALGGPGATGVAGRGVGGAEGGASGSMGQPGTVDPAALMMSAAMIEQLLARLGEQQRQQNLDLFAGEVPPPAADELRKLRSGEAGGLLRAKDVASLDVLAALFDVLFDDPLLPDAVKAALARLQIPLLKVVILDETFFSDRSHPARQFLEAVALAAQGLDTRADAEHPGCREIRRAAVAVQAGFDRDPEIFGRYGAELETYAARRDHDLQLAAQDYLSLAQRLEQNDLACLLARRFIQGRLTAETPPVVAEFLGTDWQRVMERAWIDGGEAGAAWQSARQVVDELLWSVTAKADAEERKRLAAVVPGLLRRLREGLDRVGVSPQTRAPFFDACFALQTAVLRGRAPDVAVAAPVARAAPTAPVPSVSLRTVVELNGKVLKSLRGNEPEDGPVGRLVAALHVGDWFRFEAGDGSLLAGRLAWVSPLLGQLLLLNPDWTWAISISPPVMERQLAGGQAVRLTGHSLFDEAALQALKALGGSAPRNS
jgi:hypothetical protein